MSSPRRVVVRLRPGTDGDATHTPKAGSHEQLQPPTLYLEKLGDQWMHSRGDAKPGVKYILESLPTGYTLWQRPRPKDPKHLDKYLYGHPNKKVFDSPNRFFPHFQYLMDNGDSIGCPCIVCSGSFGVLPKSASGSVKARSSSGASSNTTSRPLSSNGSTKQASHQAQSQAKKAIDPFIQSPGLTSRPTREAEPELSVPAQFKGRPKMVGVGMDASHVDEEGTPDVYRNLINKLRRHGKIDEIIEEPLSLDWRAEQEVLPDLLRKLEENSQWVPRTGEIVLFVKDLAEDVHIIRHPITTEYRMYDEKTKLWLNHPAWEAGLVGQTPTEPITIQDLCEDVNKESNVTYSGVRIESLPDVNSLDKSLSKRHKYVPIRQTRPFVYWKELLHQVPKWHPTILNAQAVASVMSLASKYRFKGTWPEASIYCRAIYVGHEMLAVGDTVRLLPNVSAGQSTSTDILVIKSIRLKWKKLDCSSNNDWDEGLPYNSSVWVYGAAYTSDPSRTDKEWRSDAHPSAVFDDYGEWYPLHPPSKELAIPHSRILGRLHERDAVVLWMSSTTNDPHLLDAGRQGLVESRTISRQHDKRISREPDANWYWADSRVQALDLHTVNGLDVSTLDQLRDPKDWRRRIKAMDGMTNNKTLPHAKPASGPGPAGRNLRGFMAPDIPERPVRTQPPIVKEVSTSGSVTGHSTSGPSSRIGPSKKRQKHIASLSSSEEDDDDVDNEIRRTMKLVDGNGQMRAKRAHVSVVVD